LFARLPEKENLMNLTRFGNKNQGLNSLLHQSAQWRRLDAHIKCHLPANLHSHFHTACVDGGCLVVLAANSMAASRLRMMLPALVPQLQSIDSAIQTVRVKIQPRQTPPPKAKAAQLSPAAKAACADAATQLAHHPQLAAALSALSRKS
jgi:hypothetical protein